MRQLELSTRKALPSIRNMSSSVKDINALKKEKSIAKFDASSTKEIEAEGILRAMGQRLSSSLLSVYHNDMMEGLKYYELLRHNLDLNYFVVQGRKVDSEIPELIMTNSDYVIKERIKELVHKIENEHFPQLVQQDQDSDDKMDSLLKDYSEVVNQVVFRAKNAGFNFIADSVEVLWKFLVVSLDKLYGIKERQMRLIFNDEVQSLNRRLAQSKADLEYHEKKFMDMKGYYEKRLQGLIDKNRRTTEAWNVVKTELQKWKSEVGEGSHDEKTSILGKFKDMQKNIYNMDNSINQISEENFEQNRMVRKDLLKSVLGLFNKGFRTTSKTIGTQTDLSMSENSATVYKFGLQEYIIPELECLSIFKHPFLPFLYKDPELLQAKVRSDEQIEFIESCLDKSKLR